MIETILANGIQYAVDYDEVGGPMLLLPRSGHWSTARATHLLTQPFCKVCGSKKHLNVHHKQPFHLFPELELVQSNLVTLCQGPGGGCHLLFGHLRLWSSYNPDVDADIEIWHNKIRNRAGMKVAAGFTCITCPDCFQITVAAQELPYTNCAHCDCQIVNMEHQRFTQP